jgi:hypothetical protein
MPEEHEKSAIKDFLKECSERLNKRRKISFIINLESLVSKSKNFAIMDRNVFNKLKFEFVATSIIKNLRLAEKNKIFLDTFNKYED